MLRVEDLKQTAAAWFTRRASPPGEGAQKPKARPFPNRAKDLGATEDTLDVAGLLGEALVLRNGTYVRMIEVWPVDLEGADSTVRRQYHIRFANMLRRLPAPMTLQIVVSSMPQDIGAYVERLRAIHGHWKMLAQETQDRATRTRRERMAERVAEVLAFLGRLIARLQPMEQRYLVVVPYNPFPEGASAKTEARLRDPALQGKAFEELEQRVALVRAALGELGLTLVDLDPVSMAQALWQHYHHPAPVLGDDARAPADCLEAGDAPRGPACPTRDEVFQAAADPAELRYLLAPELIEEADDASHVRLGDALLAGYEVYDFDPRQSVDFASILGFAGDVTHALYLEAIDLEKASSLYRNQEIDLIASSFLAAKRGALQDHGREAAIQSLDQARAQMERNLEPPFTLHWFIGVWAGTAEALEKQCRAFETQLKIRRLRFRRTTRRHLSLADSLRPLARATYAFLSRNMTADSLGSFFPFVRQQSFEPHGRYYGVHRSSGLVVALDPAEGGQANASTILVGAPRSGKSVMIKSQIRDGLIAQRRVLAIDPEREYLPLTVEMDGLYIELGKQAAPPRLSALDVDQADAFLQGAADLADQFAWLAARALTAEERERLFDAYTTVWRARGVTAEDRASWARGAAAPPPLAELIDALCEQESDSADEVARVLTYSEALSGGSTPNILELNHEAEDPWGAAVENLAGFVEGILSARLDALAFSTLSRVYVALMTRYGFDPDRPETFDRPAPTLPDLMQELEADPDPRSRDLAAALMPYARGVYSGIFANRTAVTGEAVPRSRLFTERMRLGPRRFPFVVYGMRSLGGASRDGLGRIVVWMVLSAIWNMIVAGSGAGQIVDVFIDEGKFVLEVPGAARRLQAMARRFPKYGASLWLALHLSSDDAGLLESAFKDEGVVRDLARIRVLFRQESEAAARALRVFGVSEAQQQDLLRVGQGEGWLLFGNERHIPLYVAVDPALLPRIASNQAQMQAIARASGRRSGPVL